MKEGKLNLVKCFVENKGYNVKFRYAESGKVIEISRWNGTVKFPSETKDTCDFHGSLGTLLFAQFYA